MIRRLAAPRPLLVTCLALATSCFSALHAEATSTALQKWYPISRDATYSVTATGSVTSKEGAEVSIDAAGNSGKPAGGSTLIDAAPMATHTVTVSGDLTVPDGKGSATLWVRADSADGHLDFVDSAEWPVRTADGTAHRELKMDVPSKASKLLIGVLFAGQGRATFHALKIDVGAKVESSVSPSRVVDAAVDVIRNHALNAGRLDWNEASAQIRSQTADAIIPADVYSAIRSLLARLGDRHSSLSGAYQAVELTSGGESPVAAEVKALDSNVAYIKMPAYRGTDKEKAAFFASTVRSEILALSGHQAWIVDLREDSGGNMWPMLGALEPLLGDGQIGSSVSPKKATPWFAGGSDRVDGTTTSSLIRARVAVLIGPHTSSSGEAVAIAFHGREGTEFFGAPTSGHSTANGEFKLPDGSILHLTTSADADRHGVVFGEKVVPDHVFEASDADDVLKAAKDWLAQQPTKRDRHAPGGTLSP